MSKRLVYVLGAVAVAGAIAVAVVAVQESSDSLSTGAGPPPEDSAGAAGGTSLSCAEVYSPETLAARELAFDGTVVSVSGDDVTFEVHEWFRGGEAAQVTLAGAMAIGGVTAADVPIPVEPGTRLLVAGDGGFAWSCGFTQPYDGDVAAEWEGVLAS